jgi:hypothetical protein
MDRYPIWSTFHQVLDGRVRKLSYILTAKIGDITAKDCTNISRELTDDDSPLCRETEALIAYK